MSPINPDSLQRADSNRRAPIGHGEHREAPRGSLEGRHAAGKTVGGTLIALSGQNVTK